jgi:GR25 family glycosyltransferase involved in LPS biosynthesis
MPVKRTVMKRKALSTSVASLTKQSSIKKAAIPAAKAKAQVKSKKAVASPTPALRGLGSAVINLAKRPDRWVRFQKSFAKQAPWFQPQRMDAVDGRAAPPPKTEVTQSWSTKRLAGLFHWYITKTIRMSPGERGCCGSHVKAWRLCAKGKQPFVVLEDDAVALPSFTKVLSTALAEAPKGTGMVFLSSKDRGTPKRAGEVLMTPYYVWTTVGYVIWPSAARKLLKMLPMDQPVDNFLAWHILQGDISAYSVRPAAVRQANTWNVGSDVPHSDDVAH